MGAVYLKKEREKSFDLSAGCFLICQSMKTINANGLESQSSSYRLSKISHNRKKARSFLCWVWHAWLLLSGEMRVLQHRACAVSSLLMTMECWMYVDFMCYPKPLQIPPHWPKNNRNIYETSLARTMATSPNKRVIRHIRTPHLQNINTCLGKCDSTCLCILYRVHTVCWKSTLFW